MGLFALAFAAALATAQPAVAQDPPLDPQHPASSLAIAFDSHGAQVNGMVFRPAGEGTHPTVLLLHGLPGNEQNLDLARAIQRAGWTVITFHYRGSWGSGGRFTLDNGPEDAAVLLARLRDPATARAWGVDPARIVLMGHSYGGFVAARAAMSDAGVEAVGLIAPWDVSGDQRTVAPMTPEARAKWAIQAFDDVDGRLAGANAQSLLAEIVAKGAGDDLAAAAPALAKRPLLIVTAERDDDDDKAIDLKRALPAQKPVGLTAVHLVTDHSFNDQRIALENTVLSWLAGLPIAPR